MSDTASVYAEIIKSTLQEDGSLLVQGKASDSSLDLDQQICDPAWLQRAMPAWFKQGNIREQHDAHRAIGKATEYDARDDGHYITAKIVDPVAKAKTEAGIFSGFSIGVKSPRVIKSKNAPNGVIHDGTIVEVSLVDRPANPACTLTLVKAAQPGWEGAPADLDEERGLVKVEELHLPDDGGAPDAAKAAGGEQTDAGMDDAAAADTDKSDALRAALEKGSQTDDIAAAQDAIGTIAGLIASEAAELAARPSEAYDIALLLDAVSALRRFIHCESREEATTTGPERSAETEMIGMGADPDTTKAKYSAEQLQELLRKGHAIANENGDPSFPIVDDEDLDAAIKAVGRGGSDHDTIRRFVMKRAKEKNRAEKIPDNWTASGALKVATADDPADQTEKGDNPFADKKPGDKKKPAGKDKESDEDDDEEDEDEDGGKKKPFKPFGKADSPDLVKALTDALTDDDSDLHKTLSTTITTIVEDSMKSAAASLDELVGRVEQIEQMATPGGPALRRGETDRHAARTADLMQQAAHFKALAAHAEDPDLRRGYHTKAATAETALKALLAPA